MRRFLLYVHTGRRAALRATLTVLEELREERLTLLRASRGEKPGKKKSA